MRKSLMLKIICFEKKSQFCELRHFSLHVFKRGYACACAMIGHSSCFYGILK